MTCAGCGCEIDSDSSAKVFTADFKNGEDGHSYLSSGSQAVFSEIAGSVGARLLDTATQHVTSAFSVDSGIELEFERNSTVPDLVKTGGGSINGEQMGSRQNVLGDTSFEYGLFPEDGASNLSTVWGYGGGGCDMSTDGECAGELDGVMFTGHLSFNTQIGDGMVAGLSESVSGGERDYDIAEGKALSCTTSMHSNLSLEASYGSRLQVIAGYGIGEIELDQEGYETEMLDSSYACFGASGSRVLYSSDSLLFGCTSELSLKGEFWKTGQLLSNGSDVIGNMRTGARHLRISTKE